MKLIKTLALTIGLCALSVAAQAKTQVVWWDFLSGGDGVRMKALIQNFNKEQSRHRDPARRRSSGACPSTPRCRPRPPSAQGPDVMTYHLSRIPLGVSTGMLRPFTADELKNVGLGEKRLLPGDWSAAQSTASSTRVPFDIHSIILYYNKDAAEGAGLLGDDGMPKGLDGLDNFNAALKKLTGGKTQYGAVLRHRRRRHDLARLLHPAHQQDGDVHEGRQGPRRRQRRQGREGDRDDDRLDRQRATRRSRPTIPPRSRCSPPARPRCT